MVKKNKVRISNKLLYTLIVIGILAIIGVGVYAVAPNPGHDANQIGEGTIANTLTITGGKVGIGTTTPSGLLHLNGRFYIYVGTPDKGSLTPRCSCDTAQGYECSIPRFSTSSSAGSVCYDQANINGLFSRKFVSADYSPIAVNNIGRVGIGIINPLYDLQVDGTFYTDLFIAGVMSIVPRENPPAVTLANSGYLYVDSTPDPDELCYWDGLAWQGISSGTDSNCAGAGTPPPVETAPAAPSSLSAFQTGSQTIVLVWNDNSNNENEFRIERSVSGGSFTQIAVVGADSTSYSNSPVTQGTQYSYKVRACNAIGCSAYSNTATVTVV